ncbi:MAG: Hsp70 family protein [Actinomycetota bacterium]|nr:Hsp70 family protein [Actinomycetota bacterium]
MSVLSVDLGTSNTVAVLSAHGRPPRVVEVDGGPNMPSAIFAAQDGRLVVGREAERQARLDPARFEPNPKRRVDEGTLLLGDRVVSVTEAFAAVLAKVAGEVSRQLGGARPDEVRLTHPAQWGPVRRNVLLSAARQAGLGTNLVLIPEPVAAAAHFTSFPGRSLAPGQALAVYDLGAGTFDVAAVGATQTGFVVLAEAGLPDLGGLDVDQALLAHIGRQVSSRDPAGWQRLMVPQSTADRRAQRALREDVRAAKEALSGHPQTEVPLPEQFGDVLVTRAELEDLVRRNLLRSAQLLADTVRAAGLAPDRLAGIYLVGGSSRIPLVATLIAEQLRIVPTNLDQPETAVALGALHVPQEGTSLRTEALPEERTTHMAPPPRPAPVRRPPAAPAPVGPPQPVSPIRSAMPQTSPRPAPTAPSRRTPWLVAAALVGVLAVIGVVLAVSNSSGDHAAPPATTTSQSAEEQTTTTTSPTTTTTDMADVVVGHPKRVEGHDQCPDLLTSQEVSTVLKTSVDAVDACTFWVNYPGEEPGYLTVVLSGGSQFGPTKTDYEGNTAFQNDRPADVIDTNGGGGIAAKCVVSLALAEHDFLNISLTVDRDSAPDLCDKVWSLVEIAFDKLPDA